MTLPVRESRTRSILKSLSWRVVASATTISIAWLISGQVSVALKIGGIEVFAKMLIYYFHERAWQILPRGTVRHALHLDPGAEGEPEPEG